MVSFVKNWFKSWALWVWALFIGLLASESELLPKLQSAEIKEDIPKKKIIIKKKKKVIKNEVSENEGKIEETETDREGKGQEDQDICLSPENVTHEEESEIYVTDENVVLKGSENHVIDESLVLESKNNGEIEIVLPETDNLVDDTIIESEENSDNNEEDNIPWIGAVRGSGLTRYSGVQNLMDTEEDNDQPLVVERRAPVLIPRREGGPLTLTRGSLIKSLSHEKVRLEEIPEEDRHPSPRNVESALEDTDKIWAQLVARYTEANSVEKRNQDGSDTFENKFIKDSVRDFTDENMTSKEFSDEVGKRLQMYLEMVGDNVELQNNRREEGTNEIEDENEKDLGLGEDGKHKIFIMIEDDESSGDKEETDDVFSKDYMDIKVSDDHSEADIQEHFEKDDEEKNFEEIEPTKVLECEQLGLGEGYYDEQEETQTQKISLPGNDENATEITQTPSLIKLETVDSIAKEETTDYPNDFDNMKRESEPLVEVQETASKDEEAPVFTIKIRKKSKPTIIESELLSESSTSELSSNVKNEDHDREKEKEESFHQDSKSVVEDVPAVTFILPKKKKKKETVEEKKIEEKTENQKSENDDLSLSSVLQSTDMKGGLPNEYHDSSVTNTRGEKREGETVDPYSSKRRSSRDLWKMEVEKFLEDPNTIHRERKETDKEDIFSTRFEEFPEDYIVEEDISDHPVTESNEDKIFVEEVENTDFERTANISEDHVETKESTSKVSEFQGEQIESEKDGNEKDNTFKDNDFEISANKRKLDENFCEEILETNLTKDLDINEEKSSKKLKDDMEYIHEESEPPCKIEVPKPVQLIDVCDILTNSEQNLVARILTRKNKDDVEESGDYDSEQSSIIEFKEEFSKDEPASPKIEEFTDKLEDEGQEIVECVLVEEDKLLEHLDTDEKLLYIKSQELEHEASPAEVLSTVPKSEKDIVLESIRKERDPNTKDFVDDSDLPDYLEDVKDLLVPRVRRKKTRRCDPLNEILKIKEPDHDKTPIATSSKDNILDFNKTHEEDMNEAASLIRKKASDDSVSRQNDEFSLTEEEMKELEEINKEQEAYRAAQRKELEKFLAMPAALTEQEQRELEEFLAEEETDKVAIAASEARLEALLSEVRKRLAESGMDVDDENLDRYMTLPTDLTEEEERLLSIDDDEEEEKGRNDFDSEEDYREYIKQRYLQELEEDRIRVEEEELEFGEYYDDDEDYNYEAEEDYGEGEYLESDFVVMSENEKEKVDTKDEAVGTEEEEEEASNFEEKKSKKGKKFFSLGGPQSTGSSSKGSSSKGSRASLDKQSSKGSSLEGLVEDDTNLEPSNQQSKKFFRFGSLSIKRKKKNNDEYSECDPVINKIEKEVPDANEEINTENKLARKNTSHFAKLIAPKGSSEECDLKRKENMLLLLKIMKKHNKASNTMDVRNGTESKDLLIRVINSNNNSNNNKNNNNNPHEITCINENLGKLSLESKDISDRSPNSSHCSSPCSKNTRDLPCTNVETNDWEFLDLGDTETSLRNSSNSKSEKVSRDSLTCKSLLVNDESTEKPTRVVDTPYSNSSPLADDTEGFVFIQTDRKSATNSAAPTPSCHLTSDREIDECKNRPILTEVSNLKDTEMSRAGGRLATKSTKPTKTTKPTANGVSVNNDDCLDGLLDSAYDVSTTVQSAASNPSLSCSKLSPQNSVECLDRQPSLQELIEAELTARFAPLQPDSLEGLITQEYHEHTRTIINGNDVTSSCTALLDSLEEQPFSLDSLADAESGVDLTSPHNPNSGDHSPIPPNPIPDDSSNFSVNVIDMSVYNHNHISNTTTESDALLIESSHHHHHHHHTNHFVQVETSSNLREEHSDLSVSGNVDGNDIDHTSEVNTSQNFKENIDSEIFINGLKNEKIDNSVPAEFDPTIKISDNDIDDNDEEFVNNEKLLALECKEEINHDSDALLQEHTERVNEKQVTSDVAISEDCKTVNSSKPKEDFPGSENALKVVDNSPLLNTCEKFANNDSFSTSVVSNIQIESVPNLEDSDKTNEDPEIVSVSNPLVNSFEEHAPNDSSAVEEENIENSADKNLIDTELNETENDFYNREAKTVDLETVQDHSLLNGPPDKSTFDTKSLNEFEEFEVQLSNGDTHPVEQNDPTDSKDINHQISPDLSFDVTNCQNAISVDRISETRSANDLNVAKNSELSSFNVTNGNVKDEELWPEESKPSSKAVFDDFEKMEKEVILEMEKENEEKNMKREGDKKGKKKKKKKTDSEKENKKTAYQNKDELYEKHVGPRIRSFDAAKMKNKFNKPKEPTQVSSDCRICGKQVFQMEKIVAEKASWHKNCFRCKECNKNLTLETYQSHEGSLYCKPHFKELFRPKAVVQDEAEERKERLLRRPKMIVLESNPEQLPDDVVRATSKPDYGLEELQQTLNIQERFAVFENFSKEEEKPKPEPISVRRSQSLMSKAASRFFDGQEDGEDNEDDEEEYDEEEEEEEEEEEGEGGEEGNQEGSVVKSRNKKKKERPMSFSGMGDLKAAWEQKQRREELSQSRKEEITRFRQMLCAGKNLSLKEKFESGQFDDHENGETNRMKEEIKIEGKRAASNLKKRFEQGEPFILEDDDEVEGEEGTPKRRERICSEKQEVEEIFKEAETAKKARNVFKQIDSKVSKEGTTILRSQSFASSGRENRNSMDVSVLMQQHREPVGEVVKADEKQEDFSVDTTDLASRFRFFLNYEKEKEKEMEKNRKVFRITPPREGIDQRLMGDDDTELLGRDPNLIKCSDNYQDDIDCRNTRNILQMFKKMEMGEEEEEEDEGPKPLKRFTPPPGEENENDETDEEYSDEEYSDEDEEEDESDHASKVRDELLQMLSARKAASLRAKFERWEAEVERKNNINKDKEEVGEECMPSLDTAKNLKAMFEHKAIEVAKPVASKPIKQKVNRFV